MGYRLTTNVGQLYVESGAFVTHAIERFRPLLVERRAFCPGASPPDNSCSPANKGVGDAYGFTTKIEQSKDAWGKSTYTLPNGDVKNNYSISLADPETGGHASLKVGAYESEESDFRPTATEITIVSWHASSLQDIADQGLEGAYKKNVGKGFGRRVMASVLEAAKEHEASVVSVFAPSEFTQAVMAKYTADGLLAPIPSSKAVYGDYFTEFTINSGKVDEFLAETKRRVKAAKRAFCPNASPPDNSCSPANKGTGAPIVTYLADKKFATEVATGMGIKIDDAITFAGGMRNDAAAEIGVQRGKALPTIGVNVTRDVAGVSEGLTTRVVVENNGPPDAPSIVVEYKLMDVSREVRDDPEKRHAAGREFYRIMADGVDHAMSVGAAEIRLNAAGSGANDSKFRGYAIWPRMGFDAPLPFNIRQKLPKPLSNAKTLQDLHASREGTVWWRDNGVALDVKLDLRDPSSRQMRTFNRFVQHFVREGRAMDVTAGDGWLSPEDERLIDEMWAEMWQEGRAFCPGASPPDNSCSPANKGTGTGYQKIEAMQPAETRYSPASLIAAGPPSSYEGGDLQDGQTLWDRYSVASSFHTRGGERDEIQPDEAIKKISDDPYSDDSKATRDQIEAQLPLRRQYEELMQVGERAMGMDGGFTDAPHQDAWIAQQFSSSVTNEMMTHLSRPMMTEEQEKEVERFRGSTAWDESTVLPTQADVDRLVQMARETALPDGVTLFHGMPGIQGRELLDRLSAEGGAMTLNKLTSTTTRPSVATQFSDTTTEWGRPQETKTTNGSYIHDDGSIGSVVRIINADRGLPIGSASVYKHEAEVVVAPGTRLRFTGGKRLVYVPAGNDSGWPAQTFETKGRNRRTRTLWPVVVYDARMEAA